LAVACLCACSDDRRIERDLRADDPQVRVSAVKRLAKRERDKAVPVLVRMLEDRDPRVRVEVADSLGSLKAVQAAKPLGALVRDTDARVRLAAIQALARFGLGPAEDYLVGAVMDPNRLVRRTARNRLADLGMPRPEQQRRVASLRLVRHRRDLVERLPERRVAAAKALGRCGRPEVVSDLEKLASDPYETVAQEAAEALGLVGTAEAIAALERLASRPEVGRRRALRGLRAALLGLHSAARPLAQRLLSDQDSSLRRAALGFFLDPRHRSEAPGPAVLCKSLDGSAPEVALQMAEELKAAGVVCPALEAKGRALEPWEVLTAITRRGPLASPEREWVARRLAPEVPALDHLALAVAVAQGDEPLRRQAVERLRRAHRALLEASERWLDEEGWKRIDVMTQPADPLLASEPAPPGAVDSARDDPASARRDQRLRQLLSRFPDGALSREQELMPPVEDPSRLELALLQVAPLKEAMPFLLELAERGPLSFRLVAWAALKRTGCSDPACRGAVDKALDEPRLRVAAMEAVAAPQGALVERLVPLLQDGDAECRAAAAAALARSRHEKAWPALLEAFRRSRESHLVEAFGALGEPKAERVLLALLREEQDLIASSERLGVIEALGRIGGPAATERLVGELEHPEPALRRGAALVLGRLGDRRAAEPLAVCAEDFYLAVRRACVEALERVKARDRARP
jgi:HEAT repeat protein